eukprot:CAMPEP_0177401202 /NCGR_PEP_ID=MMETSP0368-20130122/59518_1 /TAXON_ID=447022 ORGANISM="Scrippsiella hangoei-like, Strain SHHI-4" /NCGR_SAMPLE_ID=MMETSP0368 /ASSEMBLY_ACC=CAM_ASM_000363 /LENGTH=67 /DNA_ID=CAMNT_0018868755 /DNA_START=296 /DNA_END=496 /DNA_ORIENTATION=+
MSPGMPLSSTTRIGMSADTTPSTMKRPILLVARKLGTSRRTLEQHRCTSPRLDNVKECEGIQNGGVG